MVNKINNLIEKYNLTNVIKIIIILIILFIIYRLCTYQYTTNTNTEKKNVIESFTSIPYNWYGYGNTLTLQNATNQPTYSANQATFLLDNTYRIDSLIFKFNASPDLSGKTDGFTNNAGMPNDIFIQYTNGSGNLRYLTTNSITTSPPNLQSLITGTGINNNLYTLNLTNILDENGLIIYTSKIILTIGTSSNLIGSYKDATNYGYIKEYGIFGGTRSLLTQNQYNTLQTNFTNTNFASASTASNASLQNLPNNVKAYVFKTPNNIKIYSLKLTISQTPDPSNNRVMDVNNSATPATPATANDAIFNMLANNESISTSNSPLNNMQSLLSNMASVMSSSSNSVDTRETSTVVSDMQSFLNSISSGLSTSPTIRNSPATTSFTPATTSFAPATTSFAPATTSSGPIITSSAPIITSSAPIITSSAPTTTNSESLDSSPTTTRPRVIYPTTTSPPSSDMDIEEFTSPLLPPETPFIVTIKYNNLVYPSNDFTVKKTYNIRADVNKLSTSSEFIILDDPIIANQLIFEVQMPNAYTLSITNIAANGTVPSTNDLSDFQKNVNMSLNKSKADADGSNICPSIDIILDKQTKTQQICDNLEYQDKIKAEKLRLERNKQYLLKLKNQQTQVDELNSIINDLETKRSSRDTTTDRARVLQYQQQKENASSIRDLANQRLESQDNNKLFMDVNFNYTPPSTE
jgi:hypothetical protein